MTNNIAYHEIRHVFGDAIAAAALGIPPEIYGDAEVFLSFGPNEGEAAVKFPDPATYHMPEHLKNGDLNSYDVDVAALGAFGPIAKAAIVGADIRPQNILKLMKSADTQKIAKAGDLSEKDVALCESYSGPPLLPARIVLGVVFLEKRLGVAGMEKLSSSLKKFLHQTKAKKNQNEPALRLDEIVPWEVAQAAHTSAKEFFDEAISPKRRLFND